MSDVFNLGISAKSIKASPAFAPISGVRVTGMKDSDGNALIGFAGDEAGRVLETEIPFAASQQEADIAAANILARVLGYTYQPYKADGATLDPAAELGDAVSVGGVYSVINSVDTTFSALMSASVAARESSVIDHEYPYQSRASREMARKINGVETRFTVELGRITSSISATYETKTDAGTMKTQLESKIEQTASSITSSVSETYETKADADAKLNSANLYADAISTSLQSQIEQTASSIKATVSKAVSKYDTTGISINLYGYGITSSLKTAGGSYAAKDYPDQIYLDQNKGFYYKSDGTKWVKQNSEPLQLITDTLSSQIEQTASEIKLSVNGQYADAYDEWNPEYGTYFEEHKVKVTTYTDGAVSDIDFYECIQTHSASNARKPPNETYWKSISAPTVRSMVDVGLGSIILTVGESDEPNSATIKLSGNGIDMNAETITMTNVVADTIKAKSSISSPIIFNSGKDTWIEMADSDYYGWGAGFTVKNGSYGVPAGYNTIFSATYLDFGETAITVSNTRIMKVKEDTSVKAYGTWDFSDATVIGLPTS